MRELKPVYRPPGTKGSEGGSIAVMKELRRYGRLERGTKFLLLTVTRVLKENASYFAQICLRCISSIQNNKKTKIFFFLILIIIFLKIAFAEKLKSRLYCGHPAVHIFSSIPLKFSEYHYGMYLYGMNQNIFCKQIFHFFTNFQNLTIFFTKK